MTDFLADMRRSSTERLAAAQARESYAALARRVRDLPRPRPLALAAPGFDLIAEIKRRSPALGALAADEEGAPAALANRARTYAAAGAAAISVLTEPQRFDGALEDLAVVAAAVATPAMRKDFLIAPYQLCEARAAGASGALLIVRLVPDDTLRAMLRTAAELGLFVLLEVFDESDADRAATLAGDAAADGVQLLVGVNARNLVTLEIDPARLARLLPHLPPGLPRVAESGLTTPADLADVARLGYRLALIGGALMRQAEPANLITRLLAAARGALEGDTSCASA